MDVKQKSQGSSSLFSINWWRDADYSYAFYITYVQPSEKGTNIACEKGCVRVYKCSVEKRETRSELLLTELTHRFEARNPDSVEDIYIDAHTVIMKQQCYIALALICRILTCDINSIVTFDPEIPKQFGWKFVALDHPTCLMEWNRKTLRSCDFIFVRHPLLCELSFSVKDYITSLMDVSSIDNEGDIDCAPSDERSTDQQPLVSITYDPPSSPSIENTPASPILFTPVKTEKKKRKVETDQDKLPNKKQKIEKVKKIEQKTDYQPETQLVVNPKQQDNQPETQLVVNPEQQDNQPETQLVVNPKQQDNQPETQLVVNPKQQDNQPETQLVVNPKQQDNQPETQLVVNPKQQDNQPETQLVVNPEQQDNRPEPQLVVNPKQQDNQPETQLVANPKQQDNQQKDDNPEEQKQVEEEDKCPADEYHFESVDDLQKWAKEYVEIGLEEDGWVPKKKGKPATGMTSGPPLKFDSSTWIAWSRMATLFSFMQRTKGKSKVDIIEDIYKPVKSVLPEGEDLTMGVFLLAAIYHGFATRRPRWKDVSAIKFGVRKDSIKSAIKKMEKTAKGRPF